MRRFVLIASALAVALWALPSNARQCATPSRIVLPAPASVSHSSVVYPATIPSTVPSHIGYDYNKVHVKEVVVPILQPFPFFIDPRISYVYNSGTYVGVPLVPGPPPVSMVAPCPPATPAAQASAGHARASASPSYAAKSGAGNGSAGSAPLDVDALIDRIERRVRERMGAGAGANVSAPIEDGPPPVPGFVSLPSREEAPARETIRPARSRQSILQGRCGACHTGSDAKGDFVIFERRGVLSPSFDLNAAIDAVTEGRMPPAPRPPLSEEDRRVLAGG